MRAFGVVVSVVAYVIGALRCVDASYEEGGLLFRPYPLQGKETRANLGVACLHHYVLDAVFPSYSHSAVFGDGWVGLNPRSVPQLRSCSGRYIQLRGSEPGSAAIVSE